MPGMGDGCYSKGPEEAESIRDLAMSRRGLRSVITKEGEEGYDAARCSNAEHAMVAHQTQRTEPATNGRGIRTRHPVTCWDH